MNATPGQESTSCPDGAAKSVSVWHFGFDQHLLTTNSLSISLSLSIWLHLLDVVRVTRRRKQCFAESQLIFFSRYVSRMNHSTVKACCPIQLCCEQSLTPTLPGLWTKSTWVGWQVGTMPVQSWAERVCWGQRKQQPEMIDPVIHCEAKNNTRWRVWCPNGESMVNRCRKSQLIRTCSVVFQSLYFSHIEPLWWSIHWKPCENQEGLLLKSWLWHHVLDTKHLRSTTRKKKWI